MTSPIIACRPQPDYTLWVTFADGLHGSVNVRNLLDIGMFTLWRDVRIFMVGRPDAATGDVLWSAAGIRLDHQTLYEIIRAKGGHGAPPATRSTVDPGFYRFMSRALEPVELRRKRRPR